MTGISIIVFVLLHLHLQQVSASYVHLRTIRLLPAQYHKSRRNIEVLETHAPMISSSTLVPSLSPEPNEKSYQQPSGLRSSGPTHHGSNYLVSSSPEPSSERTNDSDHVKSTTPSSPYSKHPSTGKEIPMHSKSTMRPSNLQTFTPTIPSAKSPAGFTNSPSISTSFIENQSLSPIVSPAPSSKKLISTAPSDPNINPTSPSVTPVAQYSPDPTLSPSSPITKTKSQAPSTELTTSPSSTATSSTTLRPSTSLSSTPSVAVSGSPSLIASESPSQDPSHSPTLKESLLPSLAPASSDISILNVTLGYVQRAMNDEEKMQLQDIIKEFLEEMDAHLKIYSIMIMSQSLLSTDNRKLMSISPEDGTKLLNVLIRINGELQNSLNANFADEIKSLLMDNLSILQTRLAEVLPISQNYTEKGKSRYGETEEPTSSRRLIVKIGAGVAAAGILALVAFLYSGRSIGGVTTTPPRQSTLHLVPDAPPSRSTIETSVCHETDIENQSIPEQSPSGNPIEHDTIGNKGNISTLSYSETSSERLQPDHFTLTSSDTSEKLAFMGTISSDNLQEYQTESQFVSHDPVSSHTETLQVQQLRRPVFDHPSKYKYEDRMEQESIDKSSNHGSGVQSEDSEPRHKGITKLLACFAANARANYANCSHHKDDSEREHFTRLSFKGRAKSGDPIVSRARNSCHQQMEYDDDEWIEELEGDDDRERSNKVSSDLSISSLSCFSSISGNRGLGGDLYEVMIADEKNLGLVVKSDGAGPWVHHVKPTSPLTTLVKKGDYILSIDGTDTRRMTAQQLSRWLHEYSNKIGKKKEKTIVFKSPLEIDPSSRQMI